MAAKKGKRAQKGKNGQKRKTAPKAKAPATASPPPAEGGLSFHEEYDFASNRPDDLGASAFAEQRRWQLVWMRLIADAWKKPAFRKQITNPDTDLHKILEEKYGYVLNELLKLTIVDTEGQVKAKPGAKKPFDKLPKMELKIALPPPPRSDLQAIALADYADAGRSYPFTCW
jgi:ribosomally synthesized peptide (two-chain TOMM family)